jgi:hypothetical protein
MRGDIHLLPNTPSWRGAQLKKNIGTTLPLPLPVFHVSGNAVSCAGHRNVFLVITVAILERDRRLNLIIRNDFFAKF